MLSPLLIGAGLALAVALFARWSRFERDGAFYPTVLIVVGSYYILFALAAGRPDALPLEIAAFLLFAAIAVFAFRTSLWFAAAGLAAHGLFDAVRGPILPDAGAPHWWPAFCGAFDLAAAILLGIALATTPHGANRSDVG